MNTNRNNRESLPRLCFVGPMLGRNPGWVVSQGEILADLFSSEGYSVLQTSSVPYRPLRLVDTLSSLIKWRNRYDIVNLSVFSGTGFIVVDLVSRLVNYLNKPLISVLHGGNLAVFGGRYPGWVQRVLARSNSLVSPSGFLAHFFQGWGIDVHVIPNVINIDQYPFRIRKNISPRLLWMRTFHEIYQPGIAVDVLSELQRSYPESDLTMAGQDKGLLKPTEDLVASKGLQKSVSFPGFLDQSAKIREFNRHDIYLHTNRVDNMPVSLVEAAAFGLPIIASSVGGIPYTFRDEENAILVEHGDVSAMVEAVRRLITDEELTAQLSSNGRALAETFTWPEVKPKWENLFEDVLASI